MCVDSKLIHSWPLTFCTNETFFNCEEICTYLRTMAICLCLLSSLEESMVAYTRHCTPEVHLLAYLIAILIRYCANVLYDKSELEL